MIYKREDSDKEMFFGASPNTFEKARELRKRMTDSEKILWSKLRRKQLSGKRFRRQHPIDIFIVDFYCHESRLVIEVDGGIHNEPEQREYDKGRSHELEKHGLKIIRFTNEQIQNDISKTLIEIERNL